MKIKYRFLLVFVLVTVVTAGVLVGAFDSYRNDIRADVSETTEQNAASAVAILDSRLADQQRNVELAATNPTLSAHGDPQQRATLASFVAESTFSGASVVDREGRMVAIAGVDNESRNAVLDQGFTDRRYVRRALTGESYISDPFMADTGNHIIVISTPLRNDSDAVVGALTAAYDLTDTDLFAPLGTNVDETGTTVSSNGTVLYSTADGFAESATTTRSLSTTDWIVTSHYDAAAIRGDLRRLGGIHLIVSVLLIGTITGFGIWIYQSEIRHTERLHDRIENLEARTYDDDIEFSGATEWQGIGGALDRLSTTLARREQMLLVLNRFLRHNLRNDLNVVVGHVTDIKREAETPAEQQRAETMEANISSVLSTADRVRLTEALIDPTAVDDQPVDLVALVTDRIEQVTADSPELTVTLDTPTEVWVQGGETLSFAIEELLENVASHSGTDPVARISVTMTADHVTLQIADDGPGIHPDEAAIITGTKEITPLQHSSGLGLWLVNWIVRRHDGSLSIPETDTGTTIEITLPRTRAGNSTTQ
jgi:signal transduction histidine kinase